eukprot:5424298-Pyramimonas_sp.AAC.1
MPAPPLERAASDDCVMPAAPLDRAVRDCVTKVSRRCWTCARRRARRPPSCWRIWSSPRTLPRMARIIRGTTVASSSPTTPATTAPACSPTGCASPLPSRLLWRSRNP